MDRPRWKKASKIAIKVVIAIVVLWAVGRHVERTWRDLQSHKQTLRIEAAWVGAGVVLYLVALSAFGVFFHRILHSSATPVRFAASLRAYLISHLGKYVPGKAMVVVMRVGLAAPYGARPATTAFSSLYETLVMMAAGGLVAAVGFAFEPGQRLPLLLGLGLGVAFLIVVDPKVFPRLSALATMPFPNLGPDALPRFTRGLLGEGLLWSFGGWILLGLSQLAVIRALVPTGLPVRQWPMVIASVALATVAGFTVAVMPGGLGIREWVLMTTLTPALGEDMAVVSSLALRLTWVLGEALAAAVLFVARPPLPRPTAS